MEKYLKPELEFIQFDLTDIISTSGGCENDGGDCEFYCTDCAIQCNETPAW